MAREIRFENFGTPTCPSLSLSHASITSCPVTKTQKIEHLDRIKEPLHAVRLVNHRIPRIEGLVSLSGSLTMLDLSGNLIDKIENLYSLVQLEELNLSRNAIARIPKQGLSSLTRLRVLRLSNNRLDVVSYSSLSTHPSISDTMHVMSGS